MTTFGTYPVRDDVSVDDLRRRFGTGYVAERFRRDCSISDGTDGIWDFTTEWGRPGGKIPTAPVQGVKMRNLVKGGQGAENVTYPGIGYANGAVRFDAADNNLSINLATVALKTNRMIGTWFRSTGVRAAGGNSRLMGIGALLNTVLVADQDGGPCTRFEVHISGGFTAIDNPDLRAAFSDGKLHWLGAASEDLGGGQHQASVVLDGIHMGYSASFPNSAAGNAAGTIGAPDANGTIVGGFYRSRMEDLDAAALTLDQISAREMRNYDRLAAFG